MASNLQDNKNQTSEKARVSDVVGVVVFLATLTFGAVAMFKNPMALFIGVVATFTVLLVYFVLVNPILSITWLKEKVPSSFENYKVAGLLVFFDIVTVVAWIFNFSL